MTFDIAQVKTWATNRWVQVGAAFLSGALLCTLLYPTTQTEEQIKQEYQQIMDKKVQEQKDITTQVSKQLAEQITKYRSLDEEYKTKVTQLTSVIREMSLRQVQTTHKIVRADGSSEEWTYLESVSSTTERILSEMKLENERKLSLLENEWQQKMSKEVATTTEKYTLQIKEMQKTIAKLESEKTTTTNVKRFGFELGATTEMRGYAHSTYDIWGPIFFATHLEFDRSYQSSGIGLGVRF